VLVDFYKPMTMSAPASTLLAHLLRDAQTSKQHPKIPVQTWVDDLHRPTSMLSLLSERTTDLLAGRCGWWLRCAPVALVSLGCRPTPQHTSQRIASISASSDLRP